MNNAMAQSGVVLTISIIISSFCYMLMGFDAVGDPIFEEFAYQMFVFSPLLSLPAMTWFSLSGNQLEWSVPYIIAGYILGFVSFMLWLLFDLGGDYSALWVLPVFFLPMALSTFVHFFVLLFVLVLGAGFAHVFLWITKSRRAV